MGTELSRRGFDLEDPLWSAKVLLEAPDAILSIHRDYLRAGAELIASASYQVSEEGFAGRGLKREEARRALSTAHALAETALERHREETGDRSRRAAISLGPYGAMLADGSEYTGAYAVPAAELVRFHRARFEVLAGEGARLVALETLPTIQEAEAALEALESFSELEAWLSFVPRVSGAKVATLRSPNLAAVAFNCGPFEATVQEASACAALGPLPVFVYANRGGTWDAEAKAWRDEASITPEVWVDRARSVGLSAIGGCCGVGPEAIARLRARRDERVQDASDST